MHIRHTPELTWVSDMGEGATVNYDPYDYELDADPYPMWRRLRDEAPLYRNDQYDFWALSRFRDVYDSSVDWPTFSSARGTVLELLDVPVEHIPHNMLFMDPPEHDRLRRLVSRGFTPSRIAALEPRIREIASGYLDEFAPGDRFDFVQDFGAKLPTMVIGSLLGIPEQDQDRLRHLSDAGIHLEEGDTASVNFKDLDTGVTPAPRAQVEEYVRGYIRDPMSTDEGGVIRAIMSSEVAGEDGELRPLTEREVLDFSSLLIAAGNETVARLLGWAGWLLPRHPEQMAKLAANRDAIPAAIEELLRFEPPSPVQARVTTRPVKMHGVTLDPGAKVLLLTGSAGRDEREYERPDEFDIDRVPKRHVAFGYGVHFCLGAALARLEARVALEEVLTRFPTWEVDVEAAERVHTSTVRGYRRVPIQT